VDDASFVREYLERWNQPAAGASGYFEGHESRLIRTLQLTPRGAKRGRILEMGCYMQITPALRDLAGYGQIRGCYFGAGGTNLKAVQSKDGDYFECAIDLFDCERDSFPYPDGHFDTVLCCELLEHLVKDPMWMMAEIHRVLKPEGILLLTTPNIVSFRAVAAVLRGGHPGFYSRYPDPAGRDFCGSRHEREYTPLEISKLLNAAGFAVEHIETGPYGNDDAPNDGWAENVLAFSRQTRELRGDCIFACGRKTAAAREFRPSWLYDF
jgi:SAM-dependent methyltransferase